MRENRINSINYIVIICQISISIVSFTNQQRHAKISILDLIDIFHIREILCRVLRNANKVLNHLKDPDK